MQHHFVNKNALDGDGIRRNAGAHWFKASWSALRTTGLSHATGVTPRRSLGRRPAFGGPRSWLPRRPSDFHTASRRYARWLVSGDAAIGVTAFVLSNLLGVVALSATAQPEPLSLLAGLAWPVLIALGGGYERSGLGLGTRELRAVLRAGSGLVVLGAYPAAVMDRGALLALVLLTMPFCVTLSLVVRFVARQKLHRWQSAGAGCRRTLAVGTDDAVAALQAALAREPHSGMLIQGACLPGGRFASHRAVSVPVLGDLSQVRAIVDRGGFEAVAVTGGDCLRESYLRRLAWSLEETEVELLVCPGLAEIASPRLDIRPLVGVPLLHVRQPRFSGWKHAVKRTLDITLTSLGLVALLPLLVATAIGIKLTDGGPVLFRQTRIGRGGRPFEMLKFRSMAVDAEARKAALMALNEGHGGLFKLTRDPRVTPLGRFIRAWSIDELPQLFNVLSGSMSLVGPRPHLAHEVALMPPDASRRALVTPGLTGLWQISGRSDLPGSEGVRLDLRYVENWSITLDLLIIWKTFRAVITKSGAR